MSTYRHGKEERFILMVGITLGGVNIMGRMLNHDVGASSLNMTNVETCKNALLELVNIESSDERKSLQFIWRRLWQDLILFLC